MNTENSLQAYFDQQNDTEAASIVAAVVALLPSNNSVISWNKEKYEEQQNNIMDGADNVLKNILLTKESEIAALKEVILKWRNRAFEAESNAQIHFLEQLEILESQHENELKLMESRYLRKLDEKEDTISTLKDQVDYLICMKHHRDTTASSIVSTVDDDEEDTRSMISSVYDRDAEQRLVQVDSRSTQASTENILDNIQSTMRAIEQELNYHTTTDDNSSIKEHHRHHRRSPIYNSYYSSATLIDTTSEINHKKIKKPTFLIHRIFKKAFPKLYKSHNNTMKYTKKRTMPLDSSLSIDNNSSYFPRSSTDETLGVYSTANSSIYQNEYQKPVNVLDLLPAMNNNNNAVSV